MNPIVTQNLPTLSGWKLPLFLAMLLLGTSGCSSGLVIEQAQFSQPIESVLEVNEGEVHDERYGIRFSVDPILQEEGAGTVPVVRLIRHQSGVYMMTASGFRHVWILESGRNQLDVTDAILVRESGLGEPVFNQRGEWVELLDQSTGHRFRLTDEGLVEEENQ
ncbi:MAG: hypothetical protein WD115_01145 [Balneolaceae bacterium]